MSAMYGLRLVLGGVDIGNVNVSIACGDAAEQRIALIVPWLTGWFHYPRTAANRTELAQNHACWDDRSWWTSRINGELLH
jgi:hypothetical protein